jgi:hypothetical protein
MTLEEFGKIKRNFQNKKQESAFLQNYHKQYFFYGLMHTINNGTQSGNSNLKDLLNNTIINDAKINNTNNLDNNNFNEQSRKDSVRLNELYCKRERRMHTKRVNKEQKNKNYDELQFNKFNKPSTKKSSKSNSIITGKIKEIKEYNEKIVDAINVINKKLRIKEKNVSILPSFSKEETSSLKELNFPDIIDQKILPEK